MQEKRQNIAESDDSARFDGRVSFGRREVAYADIRRRGHATPRENNASQSAEFGVHVGGRRWRVVVVGVLVVMVGMK